MSNKNPIAVFDSGVGGISVLRELTKCMPNENYIFFGDSANAPYGSKTHDEIREISLRHIDSLINSGAKAVVVACNTATSVAIDDIRHKYSDIPIIGIEPALKPAIFDASNKTIIVMATPITLSEHKFLDSMKKYSAMAKIIPLACPELARLIENGITSGEIMDEYLCKLFAPVKTEHVDAIVLGCTHYPFAKQSILSAFDHDVKIYDGAGGTARETKRRITQNNIQNENTFKGYIKLFTSADPVKFNTLANGLLTADL